MPEYLETTVDKFTFRVAADRHYTPEGLWIQQVEDQRVRVGMTDYLQQHSGDVAFVWVTNPGKTLAVGDELAAVETMKAVLSLPSPVGCKVLEANKALGPTPELVNQDPYDKGWLAVIEVADWEADRAKLLDAQAYFSLMRSQVDQELRGS